MAFLSEWDDRARPKGSRDPLGFEVVWSHYGRKVIGNLTTVTGSLENFSVALLGFYWANELNNNLNATSVGTAQERIKDRIKDTFLCYEQLAGYLRYIHKDKNKVEVETILGSRRIESRIENKKPEITLGSGAKYQILSSQAAQGLWGLYYSAMKATGLVKGDDRSLTKEGEEIAQLIEKRLGSDSDKLKKLLKENTKLVEKDLEKKQCKKFFNAIRDDKACRKLLENLMKGSNQPKGADVQIALWEATKDCGGPEGFISKEKWQLKLFISKIKKKTPNEDLKKRLSDIESVERLLVAINNLFRYCQGKNGAELSEVIKEIKRKEYNYKDLMLPECNQLKLKDSSYEKKLAAIRNDLVNDDVEQAVTKILELNKYVMEKRGGSSWVKIEKNKLLVYVSDKPAELLDKKELQTHWDNSYFLYSYLNVAANWRRDNG